MPLVSKSFSDIITFSRGSNATYFDSAGVLKYAPNNAIRNNTGVGAVAGTPGTLPTNWVAGATSNGLSRQIVGTGTENGINYVDIRYSGTTSAASLTAIYWETATQVAALSGQVWTNSAYVSLVGGSTANITNVVIGIDENNSGGGYLTGSTTVFTPSSGSLNGKRYSHTRTLNNASTAYVWPYVFFSYGNGAAIDFTLRIGLPQLEIGDTAGPAIPTSGTAYYGPRFDYNPSTLAAQGLLIEEQRTNVFTYSEDFQNTAEAGGTRPWLSVDTTITTDATVAPDGTTTADLVIADATSSIHNRRQGYTGTTSTTYTYSVYVKQGSGVYDVALSVGSGTATSPWNTANRTGARFDLSTATVSFTYNNGNAVLLTQSITSVGGGWYRLSITFTPDTTGANTGFTAGHISLPAGQAPTLPWTGDGTSGAYVWGAQLEAGAFPTSYIPTTTTALTRAADVASVNTLSPWYNASEGTIYAEATFTTAATVQGETSITNFLTGTSTDNQLRLNRNASGETTRLRYRTAASDIAAISTNTIFGTNKIAAAFANGSQAICANGNAPATATGVGAMPSVDNLVLGRFSTSSPGTILNGYLRRITYYPRRLSNEELQAITS